MTDRHSLSLIRPILWAVGLSVLSAGALALHTLPAELAIALFDALGGWVAGIGAFVAARYVWKIWHEQRAMAIRDRNSEALLLETYLAGDLVQWFHELELARDTAKAASDDSNESFALLVSIIHGISVKPFQEQLPSLWRMADDAGPAIALGLSSTQRAKELASLQIPNPRKRGFLASRAYVLGTLCESALHGLQRPHQRIQERWGNARQLMPDKGGAL